jgi:hypothetical protein
VEGSAVPAGQVDGEDHGRPARLLPPGRITQVGGPPAVGWRAWLPIPTPTVTWTPDDLIRLSVEEAGGVGPDRSTLPDTATVRATRARLVADVARIRAGGGDIDIFNY